MGTDHRKEDAGAITRAEREDLERKIDSGIKASVADALEERRRMGRSVVIWRDGGVAVVPPEEIPPRRTPETD